VDVFRFDGDDRIAEHWNIRQPLGGTTAQIEERFASTIARDTSPSFDPPQLTARVREMLTELWGKGNANVVGDFYAESYVQHNTDMPGGYARIREIVESEIRRYIERTGGPFPVEVHHIGAEGDIVFVHLSLFMTGINRNDGDRSTNVDIFRVDRDGRMVEHWDVLQIEGVALPSTAAVF
jgi:predicted SnoaL-like aldol condensation-catalyzing enzyme